MTLSTYLFWDVDKDQISFDENADFIIPRVFLKGKMEDVFAVLRYYTPEKLKEVLTQTSYLDPKTLAYLCVILKLEKSDFKCYRNKQSIPKHLQY